MIKLRWRDFFLDIEGDFYSPNFNITSQVTQGGESTNLRLDIVNIAESYRQNYAGRRRPVPKAVHKEGCYL